VKFHFFHLMPYPELPDDFRERYHGVWVDLPASELFDAAVGHQAYNDYLDELEFADQAGFDGICVNEHHQNAYGLMPSPNLMVAALARRTSRAKLVVMGDSVALYNPPVRVAEEMAMLDVLSGGRLVAGFPVGTPMDTTYCYGENPTTLREKYREGVRLVLRAWQSTEPFAFNGRYTQLRYVNLWPRPMQKPHPPVWIPGGGSVETWDWCAENNFLYAYLSYFGYLAARRVMDGFWQAMDEHGVEPNPHRAGFLQFVAVADSDAEAERLYAKHALYFYNRCLHLYPGFAAPPGYTSIATIRKGIEGQVSLAAERNAARASDLTWSQILERGYVVAGSPDSVVQQLTEMEQTLRVGHLMLLLHFGDMPKDVVQYNTTRFAQDVMPRLRPLWSEWEDKWWVRPAATPSVNGVQAAPSTSSASSAQRAVSASTSD
jgi:alkanesulfonate monooxygenase SsuD/methylene tetrahydromethanopterin reductase-like flavin-dependent oxidoreductase (luciferase family)